MSRSPSTGCQSVFCGLFEDKNSYQALSETFRVKYSLSNSLENLENLNKNHGAASVFGGRSRGEQPKMGKISKK